MTKRKISRKKLNKRRKNIILIIFFTLIIGFIATISIISKNALTSRVPDKEMLVNIKKGQSINEIVNEFNTKQMLKPGWYFKIYLKYLAKFEKRYITAGTFTIPPSITNNELLERIITGDFYAFQKITFPEGLTFAQIAKISAKKANVNEAEFLALCNSDSVLKANNIKSNNVEGYLLPETYFFKFDATAKDIFNRLFFTANDFWTVKLESEAKALKMTRHQILTLASIIEAETPSPKEYRRISGVYHNRLRIGMPLQADPTVQYGLNIKRKLNFDDLKIQTKFNTYLNRGLPPTPINCPGKAAILAALEPEKHKFLYFVAVGGNRLEHNFAETFTQHKLNIKKYKLNTAK